jgi:hypothetical protein
LHEYLEGPRYSPPGPHAITGEDLPRVFGHEFAGISLRLINVRNGIGSGKECDGY